MIDNIHTAKLHAGIWLLRYFKIDLLKLHSSWDSIITLVGLNQLMKSSTIITNWTSATLINYIYTNIPDVITWVRVPDLSLSAWPSSHPVRNRVSFQYVRLKSIHVGLLKIFTKPAFAALTCTRPRSLRSPNARIPTKPWRYMVQCLSHFCQYTRTFKVQVGEASKVTTMA